jgi:hypothetical protein
MTKVEELHIHIIQTLSHVLKDFSDFKNDYDVGFYNGLELALSCLEGRKSEFRNTQGLMTLENMAGASKAPLLTEKNVFIKGNKNDKSS